jgi:1-phosphatidylinositol-4-phosphate 5-kinase
MYRTFDHRFILKTVKKSEVKTLTKMLEDMRNYLRSASVSYLTRILGLYCVERTGKSPFYLMIMECIVPSFDKLTAVFDLKGSIENRKQLKDSGIVSIELIPQGLVCKDIDFLQTQQFLEVDSAAYEAFYTGVAGDVEFLRRNGVMDYSLLLGLTADEGLLRPYEKYTMRTRSGLVCCLGVIDILQSYNYLKRLQTFSLVIRKKKQPSCVEPTLYSIRYLEFLRKIIRPHS